MQKLDDAARDEAMAALPGWTFDADRGGIARRFRFADFAAAWAFMTRVALLAERSDHHPEWSNVWNRVDMFLTTHDAGGISQRDVDFARTIDSWDA